MTGDKSRTTGETQAKGHARQIKDSWNNPCNEIRGQSRNTGESQIKREKNQGLLTKAKYWH